MILERKLGFGKLPELCWGGKLSTQVIQQHSKTPPGFPNPTSTGTLTLELPKPSSQ